MGVHRYLEVKADGTTIVVHSDLRDWSDGDAATHLAYHQGVLDTVDPTKKFTVEVDASKVPLRACCHYAFFVDLASLARERYKGRLAGVHVEGASRGARWLAAALMASGAVAESTMQLIAFVDRKAA